MRSKADHHGFTLLELLVVVTIGSILLAVAIPSFSTIVQNNRRSAHVNEFVRALTFARSQAATLRRPVTICRSTAPSAATPACAAATGGLGWADGWIVFLDAADNGAFDSADDDTVLLVHEPIAASQTSLCGNANVAHTITFSKTGMSDKAGTVFYCDQRGVVTGTNNPARGIVVSRVGRIRTDPDPNACRRSAATPPVCS